MIESDVSKLVSDLLQSWGGRTRWIIAIAGPPGAGKSTLAELLRQAINHQYNRDISVIVPMDGFHKDNAELDEMNLRWCKGAPQTFDALDYVQLIRSLQDGRGDTKIPLFDRHKDAVIAEGAIVSHHHRIILTEGNYLLLEQEPWSELRDIVDIALFIKPELNTLKDRLVQRWRKHGYSHEVASEKANRNDIPNAELVLEQSTLADIVITNGAQGETE